MIEDKYMRPVGERYWKTQNGIQIGCAHTRSLDPASAQAVHGPYKGHNKWADTIVLVGSLVGFVALVIILKVWG